MSSSDASIAAPARRHRRVRPVWLALALAFCAPDAGALSCPEPPASDEVRRRDEVLFYWAVELREAGRHDDACACFAETQRLSPHPSKSYNLGECHEQTGQLATALRTYEEVLRQLPLQTDAERREETAKLARERIRLLASRVGSVLFVPSPTPGAAARVEGQPPPAGEPLLLDPGFYHLEVSAPGYTTHRATLQVAEAQRLEYALPALSPAESSRFGSAPLVLTGAGAGLGGLAVYYGLKALSSGRRLEERCVEGEVSPRCDDLEAEWKRRANTANWLWVGAGLLVGTGITLYVLEPGPSSSAQGQHGAGLSAWAGPRAAGLSASGRF
jgi:tetratricopeptide (TPR) repeat protein